MTSTSRPACSHGPALAAASFPIRGNSPDHRPRFADRSRRLSNPNTEATYTPCGPTLAAAALTASLRRLSKWWFWGSWALHLKVCSALGAIHPVSWQWLLPASEPALAYRRRCLLDQETGYE